MKRCMLFLLTLSKCKCNIFLAGRGVGSGYCYKNITRVVMSLQFKSLTLVQSKVIVSQNFINRAGQLVLRKARKPDDAWCASVFHRWTFT